MTGRSLSERAMPLTLTLLRVVGGFLFWQHGVQKLLGWFGGPAAAPMSLLWWAGAMEASLSLFIIAGLFTRITAVILTGEMIAAYCIGHLPKGGWPIQNGGEIAVQYSLIFLLLATAGPGRLHLDAHLPHNRFGEKGGIAQVLKLAFPLTLTLVRMIAGLLFFQHGISKSFGALGGKLARFPNKLWFAGVIETIGGPLAGIGLFSRTVFFLLSGEMAIGFWSSHFPRGKGLWPILNQGEPAVLFCFIFLFLWSAGPGNFSVDALRSKSHREF